MLWKKMLVGGLGAITPVFVSFSIADVEIIYNYINWIHVNDKSTLMLIGYVLRGISLFMAGVVWVSLNMDKENRLSQIFQMGIVAPALLTGIIQSGEIKSSRTPILERKISYSLISPAFAQGRDDEIPNAQSRGWISYIIDGFFARPIINNDIREINKEITQELMKFQGASLTNSDTVEKTIPGYILGIIESNSVIQVKYDVRYYFGFDLIKNHINIKYNGNYIYVEVPQISLINYEIIKRKFTDLNRSIAVDEDKEVIKMYEDLEDIVKKKGETMVGRDDIKALVEKQLSNFVWNILAGPGDDLVPRIKIIYKGVS